MQNVVGAVLLGLDVLLLAVLLVLVVRGAVRLVRRLLSRRRAARAVVRRCDSCRRGWRGQPGVDLTLVELLAARRARRRARAAPRPEPAWAKASGWSRCPSCLSTRVRTSGEEPDPALAESRLSLEVVGYLATAAGLVLVGLAAASFAATAG